MCGIAGFFYKNGESNIPLGSRLSAMASVLGSRGLDGTGMALYGENYQMGILLCEFILNQTDLMKKLKVI